MVGCASCAVHVLDDNEKVRAAPEEQIGAVASYGRVGLLGEEFGAEHIAEDGGMVVQPGCEVGVLAGPEFLYRDRDRDRREIELAIEADGTLHPLELKNTARPSRTDTRHFQTLGRFPADLGPDAVVCLRESAMRLGSDLLAIPTGLL